MTDIEKTIGEVKAEILRRTDSSTNLRFDESWERLAGESSAAYAAFCAYRDYGPERNIRRAVEAALAGNDGGAGPGRGRVEKRYRVWRLWSTQFRWRERAADYDRYLDRLKQTEKRKTIEAREAVYREATEKMLQAVIKKLDLMEPGELAQGAVVEWLAAAINTEREIAGLVTVKKGDRDERNGGKQLEINFSPEFEGL
jgi:hypothetical protein